MTDPEVFYNREDLWTVASEVGMNAQREQATQSMEPNFVLMTLPGEKTTEFIEILPFTPANRNNLIGWIAGRSDEPHYGTAVVYDFPKDQAGRRPAADRGAHRSERAALRSAVAVEPAGLARAPRRADRHPGRPRAALRRADLSAGRAQPDARTAARGAGAAGSARVRADVRGGDGRAVRRPAIDARRRAAPAPARRSAAVPWAPAQRQGTDTNTLIAEAARDLADYQRLTAEGKLGEAGQNSKRLKKTPATLTRSSRIVLGYVGALVRGALWDWSPQGFPMRLCSSFVSR